jgi:hypothetical protein
MTPATASLVQNSGSSRQGRVLDRRTFKGFGRRWSRWPVVQSAVGDVWTLIASKSAWARRNMACLTGVETIEINEGLR